MSDFNGFTLSLPDAVMFTSLPRQLEDRDLAHTGYTSPRGLVSCRLPTEYGEFTLSEMIDPESGEELIALSQGAVGDSDPVLVRIHSECLTGETFYSRRCDCGQQLTGAMKAIAAEGRGIVVYLRQEGRGIGLFNKIRAYALQDAGSDTVDANRQLGLPDDARTYRGATRLLNAMGVGPIRLMTNNPSKIEALKNLGLSIIERVPLHAEETPDNRAYLKTKTARMGHIKD